MNCPECGARARVRYNKRFGHTVYRHYRCPECGVSFTGVETVKPPAIPDGVDCMLRDSLSVSARCHDCETCGWNRAVQKARIQT